MGRKILEEPCGIEVKADLLLSEMTANKMMLYHFISIQKKFDYLDCTLDKGKMIESGKDTLVPSSKRLGIIQKMYSKFNS